EAYAGNALGQRWALLADVARGLRWCRHRAGGLWIREELNSPAALSLDAAALAKYERTFFEDAQDPSGKRCLIGLVFTVELPQRAIGGGLEEAKRQLDFLLQEGPFELGFVEVYYGVLDEEDNDAQLIDDLEATRVFHKRTSLDDL
ncbi:MAG TPA: hypothetical protein VG820_00730, partial [Fimbriimonadaceae bacterium]|nr:hypothetical protein [Fimbriimonadaceae bacterium]